MWGYGFYPSPSLRPMVDLRFLLCTNSLGEMEAGDGVRVTHDLCFLYWKVRAVPVPVLGHCGRGRAEGSCNY